MAHLEVKPKKTFPLWLLILIAILVIALIITFFRGSTHNGQLAKIDSVSTDSLQNGDALATTEPEWNSVDFNSPAITDSEIADKDITVTGTDAYTIYTLGENILFATDQNTIGADGGKKLEQISGAYKKHFASGYIGVYGSTDSTGTSSHNKALGAERALEVSKWLTTRGAISANKVSVHSLGESEPIASNATKSGRKQNRNVQIVIFKGNN